MDLFVNGHDDAKGPVSWCYQALMGHGIILILLCRMLIKIMIKMLIPWYSHKGCHTPIDAGSRHATPGRSSASAELPNVPLRHLSPERHHCEANPRPTIYIWLSALEAAMRS